MPALSSPSLLDSLIGRDATTNASAVGQAPGSAGDGLYVVCAWPLSGQYGPGSRVLYYVLVAACVVAQKAEWLRNACLAAALLFPAVAALHGIVLAAMHVDGAVDMDVYGAFQLCSIGILAAPVTVRLSRTYFFDPGRNMIFLWTVLILAGLLSLTVEFYRIQPFKCTHNSSGEPIPSSPGQFPYDQSPDCTLTCSIASGPSSRLRGGSTNNIYVIPMPEKLTFNTATLLAAACCIPAILSLVSMWNKIVEINWKARFGIADESERMDELIEGTNGATIGRMRGVNDMIRLFLSVVEVPVFSGAVLAILILGESNFFSHQVMWQTEPIRSIGQWAPIVGTGLAALGSLYVLLAGNEDVIKAAPNADASMHHCNCSHHHLDDNQSSIPRNLRTMGSSPNSRDARSLDGSTDEMTPQHAAVLPEMQQASTRLSTSSSHSIHVVPTQSHQVERIRTVDVGGRRKVAKALTAMGNFFGNAHRDWFDDSEFKRGKALDFPEIPGEEHRNPDLTQIRDAYNPRRDSAGNATPVHPEQRSRASSLNRSVASDRRGEGSSTPPRVRSDTLEVPAQVHHSPTRYSSPPFPMGMDIYNEKNEEKEGKG